VKEYLTLGSSPVDEECLPANHPNVDEVNAELRRYKAQLEKKWATRLREVNEGHVWPVVSLRVKAFPHDFGTYKEVCVIYETEDEEACRLALDMENDMPETWEDEGKGGDEPASQLELEGILPDGMTVDEAMEDLFNRL